MAKKFMISPSILIIIRKIVENNFKKQKEIIKKYFKLMENDLVLDLGCGPGEFSPLFEKKNYIGIDVNKKDIVYASKKYDKKFLVADAKKLPFADSYFNKILVMGVFHHLSEVDCLFVMSEINRVLKDRGEVLVMEDTKSNSILTKFIHYLDQGNFIRHQQEWEKLFNAKFKIIKSFTFKNGLCFYSAFLLKKKEFNYD